MLRCRWSPRSVQVRVYGDSAYWVTWSCLVVSTAQRIPTYYHVSLWEKLLPRCDRQSSKPMHSEGKAIPVQAWTGPGGFRRLRLPDFNKLAHEGGKVASLTHRPTLPRRKYSRYSFLLEAEANARTQCDR